MHVYRVFRGGATLFDLLAPNEVIAETQFEKRLSELSRHGARIHPEDCELRRVGTCLDDELETVEPMYPLNNIAMSLHRN